MVITVGSGITDSYYGTIVSIIGTFDVECKIKYDLNTLGFETPSVVCIDLIMGASNPYILSQWNKIETLLILDLLLIVNDGSGRDIPDTIKGIKRWKNNLFTLGSGVPDVKYNIKLNNNNKNYGNNNVRLNKLLCD